MPLTRPKSRATSDAVSALAQEWIGPQAEAVEVWNLVSLDELSECFSLSQDAGE